MDFSLSDEQESYRDGIREVCAKFPDSYWRGIDAEAGRSLGAQIASLGIALAGAVFAYALACRILGVRELRALLSLRHRFP